MISDIMSPVSDDGYNVEHLRIQKQPIGSLDKLYQRRYAYKQPPAKPSASAPDRHFTMVPPLATLRQDELSGTKFDKLHGTLAALGLATLTAWRNFSNWLGGVFAFIRPQSNAFRYAALPVLLAVFGVLWLLHADTPTASGGSHSIPVVGQIIPLSNSSKSGSNNNKNGKGGSASSQNPAAAGSASPQEIQGASTIPGAYTPANGGYGGAGGGTAAPVGAVGGMGGVGSVAGGSGGSTTTPTTSSGSGTGGVLPLTLTVPSVNTSTPDGKTLLNSSGTTLQVN